MGRFAASRGQRKRFPETKQIKEHWAKAKISRIENSKGSQRRMLTKRKSESGDGKKRRPVTASLSRAAFLANSSLPIMAYHIRGRSSFSFGDLVSMARTEKSIAATRMTTHPLYECSLHIERKFAKNGARNCLSKKHFA